MQSKFEKVLIWPLKFFFWQNRKRCQKTQNFTLISNPLKKCWKNVQKKLLVKNVMEKCTFFTFTHVRQTCFAYNFFCAFFHNFFNRVEISVKFCVFWHLFEFFQKKFFLGHISTFFKLWRQTRKKRLKKSKNVFSKCVLDFNFAPIKASVFFIFKKKVKFVVPYCTLQIWV